MLGDVQQYFTTIEDAQREYDNAQQRLDTARTEAWEALKTSTDRFVVFIAERVPQEYRRQAEDVLRILPATATQVRDWARANGADSGAFEQFVQDAEAARVFPEAVMDPGPSANTPVRAGEARAQLEAWARRIGGYAITDAHIRDLMGHVDRIVAAETAPVNSGA